MRNLLNDQDPLPALGAKVRKADQRVINELRAEVKRARAMVAFEDGDHGKSLGITEANCQQKRLKWPFPTGRVLRDEEVQDLLNVQGAFFFNGNVYVF